MGWINYLIKSLHNHIKPAPPLGPKHLRNPAGQNKKKDALVSLVEATERRHDPALRKPSLFPTSCTTKKTWVEQRAERGQSPWWERYLGLKKHEVIGGLPQRSPSIKSDEASLKHSFRPQTFSFRESPSNSGRCFF